MDLKNGFEDASSGVTDKSDPHAWTENMAPPADDPAKPNIIIIIDDVNSRSVGKILDAAGNNPITMAFLPDNSTQSDMDQAKANGHDTMIHMPMEPLNTEERGIKLETSALKTAYNSYEIGMVMKYALKDFDGYIGINNHQGSAAMQDPDLLDKVMSEMNQRGLLFLDSATISADKYGKEGAEMAETKAEEHGVDYVRREVFLDHEQTEEYVAGQISKVEAIAQQEGSVIAIGHPHGVTMEALKDWMDKASDKFDFITLGSHAASELELNAQNAQQDNATLSQALEQTTP